MSSLWQKVVKMSCYTTAYPLYPRKIQYETHGGDLLYGGRKQLKTWCNRWLKDRPLTINYQLRLSCPIAPLSPGLPSSQVSPSALFSPHLLTYHKGCGALASCATFHNLLLPTSASVCPACIMHSVAGKLNLLPPLSKIKYSRYLLKSVGAALQWQLF